MKKSILKCIAVLAAISVVCAALLILGNKFLPPREVVINYGALVGDSTVSADDFEQVTVDDDVKATLGTALSKNLVSAVQQKSAPNQLVVTVKNTFKYGTLKFMIGVRVGESKELDRVLGMQLLEAKASGTMFTEPLTEEVYQFFQDKDPFSVTGTTIKNEIVSGATLTAGAVANAVHDACSIARLLVVGNSGPDYTKLSDGVKSTAADFEPIDLTDALVAALGTDLAPSVKGLMRRKTDASRMIVTVEHTFTFGTLSFMIGVKVGATQSDDRVLGIELLEATDNKLYKDTLNDEVYNYFKNKDPFGVTGDQIATDVQSGATRTAQAVADSVQKACRAARIALTEGGNNE